MTWLSNSSCNADDLSLYLSLWTQWNWFCSGPPLPTCVVCRLFQPSSPPPHLCRVSVVPALLSLPVLCVSCSGPPLPACVVCRLSPSMLSVLWNKKVILEFTSSCLPAILFVDNWNIGLIYLQYNNYNLVTIFVCCDHFMGVLLQDLWSNQWAYLSFFSCIMLWVLF